MPPKLLGQVDFDIHSMSTRLARGETVFHKSDIERRIESADGSVRRLIVGRVSFMLHLIGVGDGVVAGVGRQFHDDATFGSTPDLTVAFT